MKSKVLELILAHRSILVVTHLRPDGDAVGSSFALAKGLVKMGKEVRIYSKDPVPYDVAFLDDKGLFVDQLDGFHYTLIVALDSSDLGRLEDRKDALTAPIINIDHHKTNALFGQVNWIDSTASATGEMIYELLGEAGIDIDQEIAQDLYVAISTDTGQFVYSNTTAKTHKIAASLIETGIDVPLICQKLYQNVPLNKFHLDREVLGKSSFHHSGRLGIAVATAEEQETFGCDNTDNIVEAVRNIEGVAVSVLIVQRDEAIKVSMRSKGMVDVAEIALKFGGGGHPNAAGFSTGGTIPAVTERIVKEFEFLDKWDD